MRGSTNILDQKNNLICYATGVEKVMQESRMNILYINQYTTDQEEEINFQLHEHGGFL